MQNALPVMASSLPVALKLKLIADGILKQQKGQKPSVGHTNWIENQNKNSWAELVM